VCVSLSLSFCLSPSRVQRKRKPTQMANGRDEGTGDTRCVLWLVVFAPRSVVRRARAKLSRCRRIVRSSSADVRAGSHSGWRKIDHVAPPRSTVITLHAREGLSPLNTGATVRGVSSLVKSLFTIIVTICEHEIQFFEGLKLRLWDDICQIKKIIRFISSFFLLLDFGVINRRVREILRVTRIRKWRWWKVSRRIIATDIICLRIVINSWITHWIDTYRAFFTRFIARFRERAHRRNQLDQEILDVSRRRAVTGDTINSDRDSQTRFSSFAEGS